MQERALTFARPYKVLHGFYGNAGQPGILARQLRKMGVHAESMIVGANKFDYDADHCLQDHTPAGFGRVIAEAFPDFDIIHIHALTPFRTKSAIEFPMGIDLLAARAMGKRVVLHYRGSEVRKPSAFAAHSPFNYVAENPGGIFNTFPDRWIDSYIALNRALSDRTLVTDPELLTYVPDASIVPRALDFDKWPHVGLTRNSRPLILHAPSRQAVKGTASVLAAVETLKAEGLDFDFQLVQGVTNEEARALFHQADIIVDQLRIGWYGVLAVEAMALGKVAVGYVRDDLLAFFGRRKPPIAVANPDTIADVLRDLIRNPAMRRRQAARGHAFCQAYHDVSAVARQCIDIYDDIMSRPPTFDIPAYMDIVAQQVDEIRLMQLRWRQIGVLKGRQREREKALQRKNAEKAERAARAKQEREAAREAERQKAKRDREIARAIELHRLKYMRDAEREIDRYKARRMQEAEREVEGFRASREALLRAAQPGPAPATPRGTGLLRRALGKAAVLMGLRRPTARREPHAPEPLPAFPSRADGAVEDER